jgi:hydroxyacylglutathione hydrolase
VGCKQTNSAAFIDSGEIPTTFFAGFAEKKGLRVEHLVQTHAHIDHVLGLKATKEHFPHAPVYMHELDLPTYAQVVKSSKTYGIPIDLPLPRVDVFLEHSLAVGNLQFDVLFTPGHAPGHCVFHCKEFNFAFVGDLIFQGSIGRTDLPNSDPKAMKKSIQSLVKSLPDECVLLPGHGAVTTIEAEKTHNPYVQDWCS